MAVKLLLVLSFAVVAVSSAGILETLLSWDLHETKGRSSTPQPNCLCQTSGCLCCVDLNLKSGIDLGGPACVNIKQKENNVSLNLSYGDNPVHNATIKIADAVNRPTCMNLLSEFAQLCAKFTVVTYNEHSGYDGCLVIEPALMHSPQATYNVGCFNFNGSVRKSLVAPVEVMAPTTTEATQEDNEDEVDDVDMNTDELIAVVSASAEKGFAFLSQWLGLNLNPKVNITRNENTPDVSSRQSNSSNMSRSGRSMMESHGFPEERSDERLKRLLSAQDNILKESAKIGYSEGAGTTFVYAQPPVDPHKMNLTIVSRESRRGGRAYNIHQHVNEV